MADGNNSAWISQAASSAGSIVGDIANIGESRKQREWSEHMWTLQNKYNSPQSQMERYREAGLNPMLIYGQGTPGNAGSPMSYQKPDIKGPAIDIGGHLGKYTQMSATKAQIANIEADTIKKLADAKVAQASIPSHIMENQADAHFKFNEVERQGLKSQLMSKELDLADLDRAWKQYRNILWDEKKMTMGDSMQMRMFMDFLEKLGIDPMKIDDWIKKQ